MHIFISCCEMFYQMAVLFHYSTFHQLFLCRWRQTEQNSCDWLLIQSEWDWIISYLFIWYWNFFFLNLLFQHNIITWLLCPLSCPMIYQYSVGRVILRGFSLCTGIKISIFMHVCFTVTFKITQKLYHISSAYWQTAHFPFSIFSVLFW